MEEGKGRALESNVEQLEKQILQLNEGKSAGKSDKRIGNVNKNGNDEKPLTLSLLLQTLHNNPELLQNIQIERENTSENGENNVEINFIIRKGN